MAEYIIETSALSKTYKHQIAVDHVDLHVNAGRIYGLLGRNGAGKTTIMKMILSLISTSAGSIHVFGKDIRHGGKEIYPRIGSIIETPGFYSHLTGTQNLQVYMRMRGVVNEEAIRHAMQVVNLPYKDKKLFSNYSMGMKQRLGIANAMMNNPDILILDEPTNGLDPIGIAEMRELIRSLCDSQGKTVFISSHILSEMTLLVDDIGIIHEGKLLVEKSLAELQQQADHYLLVRVSDAEKAKQALDAAGIGNVQNTNASTLHVRTERAEPAAINRILIEQGVDVSELHTYTDSLEDYFKRITGGEGIA